MTQVKNKTRSEVTSHRLAAGIGMVLLAIVWAAGWFASGDPFKEMDSPATVMGIIAGVFVAWNLLSSVIAAGFFHAASTNPSTTYRGYRTASFRLVVTGILMLFPVPLMAQSLGNSPWGRALALIITGISMAAIIFGRARLAQIENRLNALAKRDISMGAEIEEIEQLGEPG
jgi:hypothetical protein